jgi:hypothetical protein
MEEGSKGFSEGLTDSWGKPVSAIIRKAIPVPVGREGLKI